MVDLKEKTLEQLKKMASRAKIEGRSTMKKAQLVRALRKVSKKKTTTTTKKPMRRRNMVGGALTPAQVNELFSRDFEENPLYIMFDYEEEPLPTFRRIIGVSWNGLRNKNMIFVKINLHGLINLPIFLSQLTLQGNRLNYNPGGAKGIDLPTQNNFDNYVYYRDLPGGQNLPLNNNNSYYTINSNNNSSYYTRNGNNNNSYPNHSISTFIPPTEHFFNLNNNNSHFGNNNNSHFGNNNSSHFGNISVPSRPNNRRRGA